MIRLIILFFGLLPTAMAQAQENRLDEYLNALQTKESETSKETINRVSFSLPNEYTLYTYNRLAGEYFDTDVPGIRGYKANIVCTAKDGGQNLIPDTFLVVMYYDHVKSLWRVFDFRTAADPCYEASVNQDDVNNDKFYTDKEFVYRNLGYWQMMCGRIVLAEKAYRLASTEATARGTKDFVERHMEIINSVR